MDVNPAQLREQETSIMWNFLVLIAWHVSRDRSQFGVVLPDL